MRIGIIGSGSWSVALASILVESKSPIYWRMRTEEKMDFFKCFQSIKGNLSHIKFDPNCVFPIADIKEVCRHSDAILLVTPSAFLADVLDKTDPEDWKDKIVISAIKGLIGADHKLVNEYLNERFNVEKKNYLAIVGPSHAEETVQKRLTYLTISGIERTLFERIAPLFKMPSIELRFSPHVEATQYAGVLKNVYAIAAGIAHGLEYGDNFQSVLNANAAREMRNILHKLCDGQDIGSDVFFQSSCIGDLLVTCYSSHSRNRKLGIFLSKGYTAKEVFNDMKMIAEGYYAAQWLASAWKEEILKEFPIARMVSSILSEDPNTNPREKFEKILPELI